VNAGEPPVVVPAAAAAVDAHPAPAAPTAERGVAPVAFGVFPISAVRLLIGEGGVGLIYGGKGVGVSGLEATQFKLLFEVVIGDAVIALGQIGFEEYDLNFISRGLRHAVHDRAVRVLLAAGGIQRLLRRANTIHLGLDQVRDCFNTFAEGCEHHHSEILDTENLLSDIRGDLGTMLAHRIAEFVDGVFDLAVSHFGCGHDPCHGVILSCLNSLFLSKSCFRVYV